MPLKGLDDEDEFGDDYPRIEELPPDRQAILRSIKTPNHIKECHVMTTWTDDHVLCVGAVINGVEFGAWWVGWETAGAMLYFNDPQAKKVVFEYLQREFASIDEDAREDEADAEREEEAQDMGDDEITSEDLPQ